MNHSMAMEKPLSGKRVLVTRARSQAKGLMEALERVGAIPVAVPLIKTVPPKSYRALDEAVERLPEGYDWIVFTSANAAKHFFERAAKAGKGISSVAGVKTAAIGPATAKALENRGARVDYVPESAVAESVVEGFARMGIEGKRFLMPRAEVARDVIPEGLARLGAKVDVVDAYRTVLDESASGELRRLFEGGEIDIVTLTSSSTAKNLVALLGDDFKSLLSGVKIAAIGPVTAETMASFGLAADVVAEEFTIDGLVKALVEKLGRKSAEEQAARRSRG